MFVSSAFFYVKVKPSVVNFQYRFEQDTDYLVVGQNETEFVLVNKKGEFDRLLKESTTFSRIHTHEPVVVPSELTTQDKRVAALAKAREAKQLKNSQNDA